PLSTPNSTPPRTPPAATPARTRPAYGILHPNYSTTLSRPPLETAPVHARIGAREQSTTQFAAGRPAYSSLGGRHLSGPGPSRRLRRAGPYVRRDPPLVPGGAGRLAVT